jgi:hypothetical protein
MSKDPLTPTPFDRLTTPLSIGGEREIRVVIFLRCPSLRILKISFLLPTASIEKGFL